MSESMSVCSAEKSVQFSDNSYNFSKKGQNDAKSARVRYAGTFKIKFTYFVIYCIIVLVTLSTVCDLLNLVFYKVKRGCYYCIYHLANRKIICYNGKKL